MSVDFDRVTCSLAWFSEIGSLDFFFHRVCVDREYVYFNHF